MVVFRKKKTFLNYTPYFLEERHSTGDEDKLQNSSNNMCQNDLVDSALPAPDNRQQRIAELQKLKANCKPEELQKIKTKCEILVRDCIGSLLIQLSLKDFKEVEGRQTQCTFTEKRLFYCRRIKQRRLLVSDM
jgi:hypothetical protein